MDFHSLTRKELQALCKLNKIPANLTNVAMAYFLSALEHVEGIEAILNPSQSGPNETTIIGTPAGPRTPYRTSTRPRTPVVKEFMEVSQYMTQTRRATREVVEEVKEEISDVLSKTQTARSTLRRAQVAYAAKKTEIGSVQRAYSTRRSVKLLEETMEKMCLGNDVAVKTKESSKEVSAEKEDGPHEMQMELKYDVYDYVVKEEKAAESDDEKVDVKNETLIEEVVDSEPVAELSNEIQSSAIKDVEVSDEIKETVEAISSNASSALTIEEEDEVSVKLEAPVEKFALGDLVVLANNGGDIDDVKAVVQSESAMEEDEHESEKEIRLISESVTEKETSEDETGGESSEENEIESEEKIKLPSESVTVKETSEPISEDEETEYEESSDETEEESDEEVESKEASQDKFNIVSEPVTTEDEESSDEEEEESDDEEVESKEASLADNKDSSKAKFDMVSEPVTTESNVKNVQAEENKSFDATQFPRPSQPKPSESSAEANPVIQKIANVLDEDEEEETEVKNDKNTASKKLEDRSLRELHKLLKAKLQITKDDKETNTTRIALQPLQENRLAVDELQKN